MPKNFSITTYNVCNMAYIGANTCDEGKSVGHEQPRHSVPNKTSILSKLKKKEKEHKMI